jgi:hypothetical protein
VLVTHGGVIGEMLAAVGGEDLAGERWLAAGGAVALERAEGRWRIAQRIDPAGDPTPSGYAAPSELAAASARPAEPTE